VAFQLIAGSAVREAPNETEQKESNDNRNEVTVVQERNDTIHGYSLSDVVTTKRESEKEQDQPSCPNDNHSVHNRHITGSTLVA
jgi:hypothetical protein